MTDIVRRELRLLAITLLLLGATTVGLAGPA